MTEKTEYAVRYTKTEAHKDENVTSPQISDRRWTSIDAAERDAEASASWHGTPPVLWDVDIVKIDTVEIINTYVPEFVFPTATGSVIEAESDYWEVPRILWVLDSDGEWVSLNGNGSSTPADKLGNPVLKYDAGAEG